MHEEKERYGNTAMKIAEIFLSFLRLGLSAFGGPAMVPYIKDVAVGKKMWLSPESFQQGTALSQSIPGATAMQAAAYAGLRRAKGLGAAAAYIGFGLPAFLLISAISHLYIHQQDVQAVESAFTGIKAVVVAMIANASINFSRSSIHSWRDKLLALAAGIWLGLRLNPIAVIVGACAVAVVMYPEIRASREKKEHRQRLAFEEFIPSLVIAVVFCTGLMVLYQAEPHLFDLALLMAKIDIFAFGGGYVSVPLMLHEVVEVKGWMGAGEFMDAIAMGQITPGPIVMTAVFVGMYTAGYLGAVVAALYVFMPSLFILVTAVPFMDRLLTSDYFSRALHGSLVTLVGLMAAVTGRFALNTDWNGTTIALAASAFLALRFGVDILWIVLVGAGVSTLIIG